MAVVITYVEETVGELVTWLHEKDEYFEILMDSVYGMHMGDEEDDTYNGYDTFANDDNGRNGVGGWEGPSPKTHNPNPHGGKPGGPLNGPSDMAASPRDSHRTRKLESVGGTTRKMSTKVSGVTKLITDIYSLPPLSSEEKHLDLTAQYYASITELVQQAGGGEGVVSRNTFSIDETPGMEADVEDAKETVDSTDGKLHPAVTAIVTAAAFAVGIFATNFIDKKSNSLAPR